MELVFPILLCSLAVMIVGRLAELLLTSGGSAGSAKFILHRAALLSDSAAVTSKKINRLGRFEIAASFIMLLIPVVLSQFSIISIDLFYSIEMLLLFSLIPCIMKCTELVVFQNRLLWEPNVDDNLRLKSTIFPLFAIVGPILYGYVLSLYLVSRVEIAFVKLFVLGLFVFLSTILIISVIQLYRGSSGFYHLQQELADRKKKRLRQLGELGLIRDNPRQMAARMRYAAHLIFELRNSINEDMILRFVFADYFFETAEARSLPNDAQLRIGTYLFGSEEAETKKNVAVFDELAAQANHGPDQHSASAESEDSGKPDQQLKALFADILVPFRQSTTIEADRLRVLVSTHRDSIRDWDLRFWYGFDILDYIFALTNSEYDIASFAGQRAHDADAMSRPQYIGKGILALVYSVIIFCAGQLGLSESVLRLAKGYLE
jgi:hypothetical protein